MRLRYFALALLVASAASALAQRAVAYELDAPAATSTTGLPVAKGGGDPDGLKLERAREASTFKRGVTSVVVGLGPSTYVSSVSQPPSYNLLDSNRVVADALGGLHAEITIGIAHTFTRRVIRKQDDPTPSAYYNGLTVFGYVDPVAIAGAGVGQSADIGLGIGWRFGNFLAAFGVDFTRVRQPKPSVLAAIARGRSFRTDENQLAELFDTADDNVYYDKTVASIGLRVAYTVDVVSKLKRPASELNADQLEESIAKGIQQGFEEAALSRETETDQRSITKPQPQPQGR